MKKIKNNTHKKLNEKEEKLIQTLEKSPLFYLSLASKELFHSNFIAWLGEQQPAIFNLIFVISNISANRNIYMKYILKISSK